MSEFDAARDRYRGHFDAAAVGDGWLADLRRDALARFLERGLPTTRQEEWRYTNVAPLAKLDYAPAPGSEISRDQIEALSFPVFACSLYVFVNGRFAPDLSSPRALSGEVRVESLAAVAEAEPRRLEPLLGQLVDTKEHAFAALATAFLEDGAWLEVPAHCQVEAPIHLVFVSTESETPLLTTPRVAVTAGAGSRAMVIQDHISLGSGPRFTNAVTEVQVGANASLDLVLLQRECASTHHVSNSVARVDRDGRFTSHTLTLGGSLVRNDLATRLADEGAHVTLNGLFLGTEDQLLDNHTLVDHAMPRCTSQELYKGILGGRSRGVFRGRVVVRPDAQHTDAQQQNPNLLLGAGAEIDTKPQLEIYADDVKCSHGSSIGRVDEDALFYLRARGLSEAHARSLLTRGFAAEVIDAIGQPALSEALNELLGERLDPTGAAS